MRIISGCSCVAGLVVFPFVELYYYRMLFVTRQSGVYLVACLCLLVPAESVTSVSRVFLSVSVLKVARLVLQPDKPIKRTERRNTKITFFIRLKICVRCCA